MKIRRFLAAFLALCLLTPLHASAEEESPRIVFADADGSVSTQTVTKKLLVRYSGAGPGSGALDIDVAEEGYFAVESIVTAAAAAASPIRTLLREGLTFAALDDFLAEAASDSHVQYGKSSVTAEAGGHKLEFPLGLWYCKADGRVLPMTESCFEEGGCLYVPLRVLATVFSYDVEWDRVQRSVTLRSNDVPFVSGDKYYDPNDCDLLARLIRAEAGNQSLTGKIAVGNVVLNRVRSSSFPNSIKSVIYQRSSGIQFTTAYNGTIDKKPTEECITAAKLCLEGYSVTETSLYFFNPRFPSKWIKSHCTYVMTIGDHVFYK